MPLNGHEGPPDPPGMADFFPDPFLFAGTPFAIDRIMMVRLIVLAVLVLIFTLFTLRAKLVPGRGQNMVELLLEFVEKNVAVEILGKKEGKRFLPMLTILFVGIFFMNITGVIPGINIAATSVIGMPIIYAAFAYIGFIYAGVSRQGLHYFKNSVAPSGVPAVILPLLIPIELFSTFIVRPATLAIRLVVNMVAGHIMLALTFWGTEMIFIYATGAIKAIGTITFVAALLMTIFEIFVAGLQAYIFALLTAVYIQMSVEAH